MKVELPRKESNLIQKVLYTIVFALLTWSSLFAQDVHEASKEMSLGSHNSFYIDIDNVDAKLAEKVWKKYMKEYAKVKRNRKAKEYYAMDAKVGPIGGVENLNIYSKFQEGSEQVTTYVWIDMGGHFANSNENPSEAKGIRSFLVGYKEELMRENFRLMIKDQEKLVKRSQKDLSKLERKNKDLHKDIEKLKKKIVEKEEDIVKNLKEQEDQKMVILNDEKDLQKLKDSLNAVGKM